MLRLCRVDGSGVKFMPPLDKHGLGTDLKSIRFSPDGKKIACVYRFFGDSGVVVYDLPSNKLNRVVNVHPVQGHHEAWYKTGTASARWVSRTFSGVSFSPDGKTLVYCSDQSDNRLFSLYTVPVAGGDAKEVKDAKMAWPASTQWTN